MLIDENHHISMFLMKIKHWNMFPSVWPNGRVNDDSTATFLSKFKVTVGNGQTAEFDSHDVGYVKKIWKIFGDQSKSNRQSCFFFNTIWCELLFYIKVYPQQIMFSENNINANHNCFFGKNYLRDRKKSFVITRDQRCKRL